MLYFWPSLGSCRQLRNACQVQHSSQHCEMAFHIQPFHIQPHAMGSQHSDCGPWRLPRREDHGTHGCAHAQHGCTPLRAKGWVLC